jgi:hypothetical protein
MRELRAIFEAEPASVTSKLFGSDELIARVYPGKPVTQNRRDCINNAMKRIGPELGVKAYRSGRPKTGGWAWRYRRELSAQPLANNITLVSTAGKSGWVATDAGGIVTIESEG